MKERRRFAVILPVVLVMSGVCFGIASKTVDFLGCAILWAIGTLLCFVGFFPLILRSAEMKYVDDSKE